MRVKDFGKYTPEQLQAIVDLWDSDQGKIYSQILNSRFNTVALTTIQIPTPSPDHEVAQQVVYLKGIGFALKFILRDLERAKEETARREKLQQKEKAKKE